jgi:hypothetical protein
MPNVVCKFGASVVATLCLALGLTVSMGSMGCAGRVRYYDDYHHDYHTWDHHEEVIYRSYWGERHEPYRDFSKLSPDEQRAYWKWYHDHQ